MLENDPQLDSYQDAPWPDKNIVHEDENVVVYNDGFPVTEGHLLFVPKKNYEDQTLQNVLNMLGNGAYKV